LNRLAAEIRNKLCGLTARDLKTNDVLRVVTAKDAAAQLYEMDAVLRERTEAKLHFGREFVSRLHFSRTCIGLTSLPLLKGLP
jgi:hypothetical protein